MSEYVINSKTENQQVADKVTNHKDIKPNLAKPNAVKQKGKNSGLLEKFFFVLVFVSLVYGWALREEEIFTAETGWGYWLGIIGGTLMLVLMLYPMRKHAKFMRNLGPIQFWFRFHMAFGVLGPVAVLYHANFGLGSVNSNVALFAMLTVATSGLIGRFFYRKIHNGLYGKKESLAELENNIRTSAELMVGDSQITSTELIQSLEIVKQNLMHSATQYFKGLAMLPFLSLTIFIILRRINKNIARFVVVQAQKNELSKSEAKKIEQQLRKSARQYLKNTTRVVEYVIYERIFSLWHVLHLPLFIIMLLTGLFHVYAVHMY